MRALVYCRVSTQEQATDDHYSLTNQEARCRDYIKHRSWQLVKVLRDVGSGKSAERPYCQELLLAIREKRVDAVVVYRLDRLSRHVVDVYGALDAFSRNDVAFVSVQESFDTTTAMGRAMLGVAAVFAQLTQEMISENTKDGAPPYMSYRHRNLATGGKCLHIQKSGRRLEELVVEQVRQLAGTRRLRESAMAVARAELRGKAKPLTTERDGITRKLAEGEEAFDKWVDRLDRGVIEEEQFARLNEARLAERRELKRRLQKVEEETERKVDLDLMIAEVERILTGFDKAWQAMTVDEKRETLTTGTLRPVQCVEPGEGDQRPATEAANRTEHAPSAPIAGTGG